MDSDKIWKDLKAAEFDSQVKKTIDAIDLAVRNFTLAEIIAACDRISEGLKKVIGDPCPVCGKCPDISWMSHRVTPEGYYCPNCWAWQEPK